MLGKTQRVTAPTGLPKVMESAVDAPQEPPGGLDRGARHSAALLRGLCAHGGVGSEEPGAPMQQLGEAQPVCRPTRRGVLAVACERQAGASGGGF
jgi:hypothetical protein